MPTVWVCKVSWDHDYSTNAGYFIQWSQVWKRNELIILFPKWRFLFFYRWIESLTLYHYLSIFSIKITLQTTALQWRVNIALGLYGCLSMYTDVDWSKLFHTNISSRRTECFPNLAVVVLFSDWKLVCITAISGDQGDFLCGILRYRETSNRL